MIIITQICLTLDSCGNLLLFSWDQDKNEKFICILGVFCTWLFMLVMTIQFLRMLRVFRVFQTYDKYIKAQSEIK